MAMILFLDEITVALSGSSESVGQDSDKFKYTVPFCTLVRTVDMNATRHRVALLLSVVKTVSFTKAQASL